jgi:tripeptidyl-peptidase-1
MKLGLMGTTIVVAAGDDGAPGWYARTDLTQCRYAVMFPASCPYITSIGATMVSAQSDSL